MKLSNLKRVLPLFFLTMAALTVPAFAEVQRVTLACLDGVHEASVLPHPEYCNYYGAVFYDGCELVGFIQDDPPVPHSFYTVVGQEPTCTDSGVIYTYCNNCPYVSIDAMDADPAAHNWSETNRVDATTASPGSVEYTCSLCDETKTETIPQLSVPPAPSGGVASFAEAYGLELADGERKRITFKFPDFDFSLNITNALTMEYVVELVDEMGSDFGYTVFYDKSSGLIAMTEVGGEEVELKVFVDDEELAFKPSSSAPSTPSDSMTMTTLLSTIGVVFTAAISWMGDVCAIVASNPLFLTPIVFGFIGVGISLFSRLLRA